MSEGWVIFLVVFQFIVGFYVGFCFNGIRHHRPRFRLHEGGHQPSQPVNTANPPKSSSGVMTRQQRIQALIYTEKRGWL